jgi:hypothetical protein
MLVSLRPFLTTVLTLAAVPVLGPTPAAQIARSATHAPRTVPFPPGLMSSPATATPSTSPGRHGSFVAPSPAPGAQSITTGPDGLYASAEKVDKCSASTRPR